MLTTHPRPRYAALGVVLACALLSAVGCSSGSSGGSTTPSATPAPSTATATATASTPTSPAPSTSASGSPSASATTSASAASGTSGVTSATVTIQNFAFAPADLTVAPGATITVTNQDSTAHTFTATGKAFDSGTISSGKSATVTAPTTPGSYPYMCSIHPFMKGTLTVK